MSASLPRSRGISACRRLTCAKHWRCGSTRSGNCRRTPTIPRSIATSKDSPGLGGVPRRLAESALHLAPQLHGGRVRLPGDGAPPDRLPRGDRLQHLPAVREAKRQAALRERVASGHQAPDDGVAALAIEHFARLQLFLRYCNRIGTPASGAACWLATQSDGSHRDADLEADQVPALVEARVAARRIGFHAVLAEATLDVLRLAFEDDEDAEANVIRNRRAIRAQGGDHFDLAFVMQHAAFALRPHQRRNLVDRARRVDQAFGCWRKARDVAYLDRLDRPVRAVQERVEHFRIQAADLGLLGREAVVAPHGFGGRLPEVRQPLVAAARGDHWEA